MKNCPIGVFDSGLGGLTAVREIKRIMPGEDIIYFGDTGRVPYGNRSRETIIRYTKEDIEFLLRHDIKLIIAACGTASSVALPKLYDKYDIKIMGVLEGACKEAVSVTRNKRVGVIGTAGTVKSGKYAELINSLDPNVQVFSNACPMFVPLVENGYSESRAAELIANDYLLPLKNEKVDTLILGCTHYPLLTKVISDIMGDEVTLLSPGALAAQEAKAYLEKENLLSDKKQGVSEFYVSDSVDDFAQLGSTFLGETINTSVHLTEVFEQ
ncbi:MAG: glutamate racemase [Clostridia bacterium]|nr:glutamate racemase [Clostridia bacterium]